jgi:hypothetical protein
MNDAENFLARWSRRKREAHEAAETPAPPAVDASTPAVAPAAPVAGGREQKGEVKPGEPLPARDTVLDEPSFDLTRLPPIESITAATDVRAFLQPGVPPELTRAALRRAWVADPAIRDFVGLAEYAWDFTAPGAMEGFGPLEMTDELRRQMMQMIAGGPDPEAGERPDPTAAAAPKEPSTIETSPELAAADTRKPTQEDLGQVGTSQDEPVNKNDESRSRDELTRTGKVDIALQQSSENTEDRNTIVQRSHGRALPE